MNMSSPKIAIIDSNTLAVLGLRQLLQTVVPIVDIECFGSMTELMANAPDSFVHYFVSLNIMLENRNFFIHRQRKTIVLAQAREGAFQPGDFHSICTNVPERALTKQLLTLLQHAHSHGRNLPPETENSQHKVLSDREIEVMSLVVQGYINKQIADHLNIGLATVVTHRKNIMEKLGVKSVSALTIYAVTHGYVDINRI